MSTEVYEKILEYQNGNKEAAWALVEKFTPLLKHYAYLAQDEDSFEDLQCALLTFLKNLQPFNLSSCEDGVLIQYICVAVRHEYCKHLNESYHVDFLNRNGYGSKDDSLV